LEFGEAMSVQRKCPSCSAPLDAGASFCSECGTKVEAPPKAAPAKHTMLGVSPEQLAAMTRAAAAAAKSASASAAVPPVDDPEADAGRSTSTGISEPPRGQMGRTVLGMTPPPASVASTVAQASEKLRNGGTLVGNTAGKPHAKTMFGVGALAAPRQSTPPSSSASSSAAGSAAGKVAQKTLFTGAAGLGITRNPLEQRSTPLVGVPVPAAQLPTAPASPAAASTASAAPSEGDLQRTQFGSADLPAALESSASLLARSSRGPHTMLGLEDDAPGVGPVASSSAPPSAGSSHGFERTGGAASIWDHAEQVAGRSLSEPYVKAESTLPPVKSGMSPGKLLLVLVLFLAAVGLALLATFGGSGPDVRVRVASEAGRDTLEFEVPGALAGAKLRFGGQEQPLAAGRASFALGADAIRVGENVVLYDLIEPDGDVESGKITLSVDYRVTLDIAPLRAGKAAVDVVVAARPGSQVWLDGQPLPLDAQGRAVRSDPLELTASTSELEHLVRYRVQPPAAEATVGELRTVLRVTKLAIDRPGAELTTDREVVEIAGEVEPNASVTIDGAPAEVRQGRFLHRYTLPAAGERRPQVMAMAEGKAPRVITLRLTRVADLAAAAKSFVPDAAISYVKLAQNPAIYRGQKVALEGRVYNVSVQGGHSALQVLVRECPKGKRCPLWVSYPAATDITVDGWVRVLGTVDGEQAFVSETGEQKSVPKVQAAFLLPAEP
jgi:hypothetical protein